MSDSRTMDQLLIAFCNSKMAEGLSLRTVEWYRDQVRWFLDWLRVNQLEKDNWLHRDVIELYLIHKRQEGHSPATVSGHYRGLHGFFSWLVKRDYIARSPMIGMKPPKVPKKEPKRAELATFGKLLESIPQSTWVDVRDRLIVNSLFLCGLRLSECAALQADDFRLAEHLLLIREGKGGDSRLVPLLPPVERAFTAYIYMRPAWPDSHLFLAANGAGNPCGPFLANGVRQMLYRRCKRAGLPKLNPHSFRHGLAMYLLNEGGDMSLVQRVLGHKQISTTAQHYAEWRTLGMQREFSARMGNAGK